MSVHEAHTGAIYPGTFDPLTNGHLDLIERASKLFPHLIVAIAANPRKQPRFSLAQRTEMVSVVLQNFTNIEVKNFDNLLIDFVKQEKAHIVIRGLRAITDFEYEFQLASMNRRLMPELETVFLTPSEAHTFISSSLVREIIAHGGNISPFVPQTVAQAIQKIEGI